MPSKNLRPASWIWDQELSRKLQAASDKRQAHPWRGWDLIFYFHPHPQRGWGWIPAPGGGGEKALGEMSRVPDFP